MTIHPSVVAAFEKIGGSMTPDKKLVPIDITPVLLRWTEFSADAAHDSSRRGPAAQSLVDASMTRVEIALHQILAVILPELSTTPILSRELGLQSRVCGALDLIARVFVEDSTVPDLDSNHLIRILDRVVEAFSSRDRSPAGVSEAPSVTRMAEIAEILQSLARALLCPDDKVSLPTVVSIALEQDLTLLTGQAVSGITLPKPFAAVAMISAMCTLATRFDADPTPFSRFLSLASAPEDFVSIIYRNCYLSFATRFFRELGVATRPHATFRPHQAEEAEALIRENHGYRNWTIGREALTEALLASESLAHATLIYRALRTYGAVALFAAQERIEMQGSLSIKTVQMTQIGVLEKLTEEGPSLFRELEAQAPHLAARIRSKILDTYLRDENPKLQAQALLTLTIICPDDPIVLRRIKNLYARFQTNKDRGEFYPEVAAILEQLSQEILNKLEDIPGK